ncbi:C-type lectin 37Da-like [Drosophila biarmipes]|uniref:C-type lectin 37Da-like n=1 Tax=Drosophila biarmipes TaxID=125945 RepID=UPI0021CCC35F|nr:C-type lectin 37Da-like [Drosophila biarmipes]
MKCTNLCAFLAILSLSGAYKITSNVIDGVPGFLNITTAPFIKIGSNYYLIESKEVNWFDASESCNQMEADLVAFESLEELQLVSQYIIDNDITTILWTSGTDLAKQDRHVWFSNGRPVASNLRRKGEPNNAGGVEHCDELNIQVNLGMGLNDRRCEFLNGYICKARQPKTASFIVW